MVDAMPRIQKKIQAVVQGKMPHAEAVLLPIVSKLSLKLSRVPSQYAPADDNEGFGKWRPRKKQRPPGQESPADWSAEAAPFQWG